MCNEKSISEVYRVSMQKDMKKSRQMRGVNMQ